MSDRLRANVRVAAVVAPAVVAALAGLARDFLTNTSAALVLVLVVVAVAAAGDRIAGILAALSAVLSFDFFLTAPYYRFAIFDRDDIQTAVLLLAIGFAVSEIAWWGRRQSTQSSRRAGYLSGVARAARLAADGSSTQSVGDTIAGMISELLDLDACRFEPATGSESSAKGRPMLHRDGTISWAGRTVNVRREGLPGMDVIELPAGHGGDRGRFLLTASTEVRRPEREQLLVAVTLAEQLTEPQGPPPHADTSAPENQPPPSITS
jgi:K+-sensing histidine kinase KdpD